MTAFVTRRIITHLRGSNSGNLLSRAIVIRFNGTLPKEQLSTEETGKILIPSPVPGKIQAAVLTKFNEPLTIENVEIPKLLNSNEVLIDVNYCALNGSDILLAENLYLRSPALPTILGYEVVGKLTEVGEDAKKEGYKVGDQVVALNRERYGGLAEQCLAEIGDVWKIPSSLKMVDVVCLLNHYIKALIGLQQQANLEEDEIVLVNVGLGGVGLAAVDLAANVFRSQVIAVSVSEERANLVREKGAFASLKFHDRKLMNQITKVAAERDIAGVFEGVDGENFKKILDCFTDIYKPEFQRDMLRDDNFAVLVQHLSREGRVIVAGIAPNKSDEDAKKSTFTPSGIDIRKYRENNHEAYHDAGQEVLEYFEEGLISPSHSLTIGLNRVNEAFKFMSDLKNFGKVIIDLKNRDVGAKATK